MVDDATIVDNRIDAELNIFVDASLRNNHVLADVELLMHV